MTTRVFAAGSLAVAAAAGGCAYNDSPLNTSLDRDELCDRVKKSFYIGMPREDVEAKLAELSLDHTFTQGSTYDCEKRDSCGFHPRLEPGGIWWTGWPMPIPYASPSMHLTIDESNALLCVSCDEGAAKDWSGGLIIK